MLLRFGKRLLRLKSPGEAVLRRSKASVDILADKRTSESEFESAKPFDDIPGDFSIPLLGTVWTFFPFIGKYDMNRLDTADMYRRKKYGKIVRDDIGPFGAFIHIFDVKDFEKVFRYEGKFPNRIPFLSFQEYRKRRKDLFPSGGLLVDAGQEWYDLRSKVQKHMLRFSSVHYYLPGMDAVTLEMVQRMESFMDANGEIDDLLPELYRWALESVSLVAFDANLGCLKTGISDDCEAVKMIKAVNVIFELLPKMEFSGLRLWKYFPTPARNRMFNAFDLCTSVSQKYIAEALERLKTNCHEDREMTFLEHLLITEKMDMGSVNIMIMDMLMAGIDTTSHTVAFTLYHLAKNPEAQDKVSEEIKAIFPNPEAPITTPVLNEARYLKACLKESMRLVPTIAGTSRIIPEDMVLSGYHIPAKTCVIIQNMVAGHLEEYFPEPMKFKPERWLRGHEENKTNSFVSLPFGFGPRSCIGKRIAEQEIWTFLIRLFQRYKVEYHHEDIGLITKLTNNPDKPLKLKFVPR